MKKDKIILPLNLYYEHLTEINGINFTPREVDVISCILNGKTTEIAEFLSIGKRAVERYNADIRNKAGGLSNRGQVRNFIEKSSKLPILKHEYYFSLCLRLLFEEKLKELRKILGTKSSTYLFVFEKGQKYPPYLIPYLKEHLKLLGFEIKVTPSEKISLIIQSNNLLNSNKIEKILYLLPKNFDNSCFTKIDTSHLFNVVFLLYEYSTHQDVYKNLKNFKHVTTLEEENYYFSFFEILKLLFPDKNFEKIIEEFKQQYENSTALDHSRQDVDKAKERSSFSLNAVFSKKRYRIFSIVIFAALGISSGGLFIREIFLMKEETKKKFPNVHPITKPLESLVHSDLIIPNESTLLNRPNLIKEINGKFKNQSGIQTVALVGMGGAGKTTLARQYAHQQNARIIWEFNAETPETLRNSFEKLAQKLAITEADKKRLRIIHEITNFEDRQEKILEFVKGHLRTHPIWFLLYDNVEKFKDIQNYFPVDQKTWGQGKIILTTRDTTIINNSQVDHIVHIEDLTKTQKLELFKKIVYHMASHPLLPAQEAQILKFLEHIPPFPLDVSVAAYYLKSTHISYEKYLENLKNYSSDFNAVQEDLLKEAGTYLKTRYSIIVQSLEHLIQNNKEFEELLLFISLLDSQNIPRDLLEKHKNNAVLDSFIYHLKKHSLITEQSPDFHLESIFFIHRSTQKIILYYLVKKIELEKRYSLIRRISNNLKSYADFIIEEENSLKMKRLENHCRAFLDHNDLLTEDMRSIIMSKLGYIKYYLGKYVESKKLIEESFIVLSKYYNEEHFHYTQSMTYLGVLNRELGNYDIARDLLEKCVVIYKKNFYKKHKNLADTLLYLGMTYRNLGNYKKAKELMEEGLSVYEKYCPNNHAGIARALGYLGYIYRFLGDYKKSKDLTEHSYLIYKKYLRNNHIDIAKTYLYLGTIQMDLYNYEESKKFFEQALKIFKEYSSTTDIAWVLGFLGYIYIGLGEYNKAEQTLLQCLSIYQKDFPENQIDIAWVLAYLGDLYKTLGEYEKAKDFAEKSYTIYKKNLGKNNISTAWVLTYLGDIYQKLGKQSQSKAFLERSLHIHKTHFDRSHPRVGWAMLQLGKAYLNCGDYKKAENLLEHALAIYKKNYRDDNIAIAHAFSALGQVYLLKSNFDLANDFFQKALIIFQKQKNPETYIILENLAELRLKMSLDAIKKGSSQQSVHFENQAINYLKQALDFVKTYFPANSLHIVRIQEKLEESSKNTY